MTKIYILLLITTILADIVYTQCVNESNVQSKRFYNLSNARSIFDNYNIKYGRNYTNRKDYNYRYQIFIKNLKEINKLNKKNEYTVFGINQYTDRSPQDMMGKSINLNSGRQANLKYVKYKPRGVTPKQVDYCKKGYVTEVKDQQSCGSCYVFSVIGNIEGQYAKKHKQLVSLSEQHALDCDSLSGGCNGGWADNTIAQLIQQGGCVTEEEYPYNNTKGKCETDPEKIVAKVTDGYIMNITNLGVLKNALANIGPLAIGIETCPELYKYQSGIFREKCRGPQDHSVVLVGYGSKHGMDYWIIKNSWGVNWGEGGYIRVQIRDDNICALGLYVYTAVVA